MKRKNKINKSNFLDLNRMPYMLTINQILLGRKSYLNSPLRSLRLLVKTIRKPSSIFQRTLRKSLCLSWPSPRKRSTLFRNTSKITN